MRFSRINSGLRAAKPTARVGAFAAAALGVGILAWSEAPAHPAPYVTVVCSFADSHGRPLSGLTASLHLRGAIAEADIQEGTARIGLEVPDGYAGPVLLKVFDPWRRLVPNQDSTGRRSDSLTFPFVHRDTRQKIDPVFSQKPFELGIEFLGPAGLRTEAGKPASAFTLAWSPDTLAPALAKEVALGEEIDRRNREELKKRMAEMRDRGWTP